MGVVATCITLVLEGETDFQHWFDSEISSISEFWVSLRDCFKRTRCVDIKEDS